MLDTLGQNYQMVTARLYEDLFDLITATSEANSQELEGAVYWIWAEGGRAGRAGDHRACTGRSSSASLSSLFTWSLISRVRMPRRFTRGSRSGLVYRRLVDALRRRLEHLRWMAKTELSISVSKSGGSGSSSPSLTKRSQDENNTITALEGLTGHLFGLPESNNMPLALEHHGSGAGPLRPQQHDGALPGSCSSRLLKKDRPDLALELNPLPTKTPSRRTSRAASSSRSGTADTASFCFRKAAIGLSMSIKNLTGTPPGLLDDTEWNLLNSELTNYYAHIVSLYDSQKACSYVMESLGSPSSSSSAAAATPRVSSTEMLSRAVRGLDLHLALRRGSLRPPRHGRRGPPKAYLRRLVEKMCETGQSSELTRLPFSGLQTKVDDILVEKCRAIRDVLAAGNGVPPYHQILYAWRIGHNDHRGGGGGPARPAAETPPRGRGRPHRRPGAGGRPRHAGHAPVPAADQRAELRRAAARGVHPGGHAPRAKGRRRGHPPQLPRGPQNDEDLDLQLAGACQAPRRQTAAAAGSRQSGGRGAGGQDAAVLPRHARRSCRARRFLMLADLRKQYQRELDRIAAIQNNQFGFEGGDDLMDLA